MFFVPRLLMIKNDIMKQQTIKVSFDAGSKEVFIDWSNIIKQLDETGCAAQIIGMGRPFSQLEVENHIRHLQSLISPNSSNVKIYKENEWQSAESPDCNNPTLLKITYYLTYSVE